MTKDERRNVMNRIQVLYRHNGWLRQHANKWNEIACWERARLMEIEICKLEQIVYKSGEKLKCSKSMSK